MKSYLMIFIFLFSSLSSQWVGAVSSNKSVAESGVVTAKFSSSDSHLHHGSSHSIANSSKISHDSCPSMQTTEETVAKCTHCGDNCQCASGQTCQHTSPVVSLDQASMTAGLFSSANITSYSPLLVSIAISPEYKPPQA